MGHKRLTKEEKHWQAEVDANTLASANEIRNDKTRMVAAKKIAATEAQDLQKRTRAMQTVARAKTPTAPNPARKAAKKTTARKATNSPTRRKR